MIIKLIEFMEFRKLPHSNQNPLTVGIKLVKVEFAADGMPVVSPVCSKMECKNDHPWNFVLTITENLRINHVYHPLEIILTREETLILIILGTSFDHPYRGNRFEYILRISFWTFLGYHFDHSCDIISTLSLNIIFYHPCGNHSDNHKDNSDELISSQCINIMPNQSLTQAFQGIFRYAKCLLTSHSINPSLKYKGIMTKNSHHILTSNFQASKAHWSMINWVKINELSIKIELEVIIRLCLSNLSLHSNLSLDVLVLLWNNPLERFHPFIWHHTHSRNSLICKLRVNLEEKLIST